MWVGNLPTDTTPEELRDFFYDEDFLVSDEILQGGCDEGKGIHSANRTTGHLTLSAMPIVLFGTLSMVLYVLEKVWEGLKWLWKVLTLG